MNTELKTPQQLELAIEELTSHLDRLKSKLLYANNLVATGAFKYSSPEYRKNLINELVGHAETVDDMSRAVIKGIKKQPRERLRDDDAISRLVSLWSLHSVEPIIPTSGTSDEV